ncbi:MAG: acetyl-CoA carboxylase biotin carboxylase subunit [Chloroflexota bacterium]
MFEKVLVANRGEIAVRIIRTCREMGIRTVAVYSEADRTALHVRLADEAYLIGAAPAAESYLRMNVIIDVAQRSGVGAIHPGYGFLSENPEFADACRDAGIVFVGPSPEAMRRLGDKLQGKRTVASRGVPLVPGTTEPVASEAQLRRQAREVGYPLLIKASAGGGGRGIHAVHDDAELLPALRLAQGEAQTAFGDNRVFLERYLDRPRHVEVQILADEHGHCIHLGERECSVQRRHQKLIEESPSPVVGPELRQRLGAAAIAAAQAAGYTNAGTVEFLLDQRGDFFFLEVNTRLQVEHPVTEWVTGLDLVREQLCIAAGEPLTVRQNQVAPRGAAIECRITAEDPEQQFLPFTGTVERFVPPGGPGVRFDHMLFPGLEVTRHYDSLLGKLVVWHQDRARAVQRMERALRELTIDGLSTTIPFHRWAMVHPAFQAGELHTGFIDQFWPAHQPFAPESEVAAIAAVALAQRQARQPELAAPADAHGGGGSRWRRAGRGALARG